MHRGHPSDRLYVTDDYVVTHTRPSRSHRPARGHPPAGAGCCLSLEIPRSRSSRDALPGSEGGSQAVRTGYLSSSDWHRLTAAAGRLSEAQIFIDDSPGLTVLECAREGAAHERPSTASSSSSSDYLQLKRGARQWRAAREISESPGASRRSAKGARRAGRIALSQLSARSRSRATRRLPAAALGPS